MKIYPSLASRLKTQHEGISQIIAGIDPARLHHRPFPGKWNIQEHIAHLAKYQSVFTERVALILREDKPLIDAYSAEDDPEFEMWRTIDTFTLLKQLDYERKLMVKLIGKLSFDELERKGIHEKFAELTIVQWTEFFVLHEAHHLFAIFKLATIR